ncbi:MAG: FAD-binding oxidoreductase [Vicinamibacteria bacterium]
MNDDAPIARRLLDEVEARPPSPHDPRIDGLSPALVLEPENEEGCARALALCHRESMAVVPLGSGTRLEVGNPPSRLDVYLSTRALSGVEDHIPGDLTVAVRAGTHLDALNRELARSGQFLPLDPPAPARATVGGILALGEPGFRRRPGARPRDLLLGLEAVLADGTRVKAGGRVVKNVAGYELTKLFVGSAGTLAVLTLAFLRLRAIPEEAAALAVRFRRASSAAHAFQGISRLPSPPEVAVLLNPELSRSRGLEDWTLLLRFEGFREETREAVEEVRRQLGPRREAEVVSTETFVELRDFPLRPLGQGELLLRGQVAPARTFPLAESWQDGGPLVAYLDSGLVYSHTREVDALGNRNEAAAILGGNVVLERAPADLKKEIDVFGEIPEGFEIMKRIKGELDPRGILSPGRFVGRL